MVGKETQADRTVVNIKGDGNIIGDHNSVTVTKTDAVSQGITAVEFGELLTRLRAAIAAAGLPDREREIIDADVESVEEESKREKPSLPVLETKLKGIESIVKSTAGIGTGLGTLVPLIQRATEYAQMIFR